MDGEQEIGLQASAMDVTTRTEAYTQCDDCSDARHGCVNRLCTVGFAYMGRGSLEEVAATSSSREVA